MRVQGNRLCVGVLPQGNAPRSAFKAHKEELATRLCHSSSRDLRQQLDVGIVLRSNYDLAQITGATFLEDLPAPRQLSRKHVCIHLNFQINILKMWIQNEHSHFVVGKERPRIFTVVVIGFRQCLTVFSPLASVSYVLGLFLV